MAKRKVSGQIDQEMIDILASRPPRRDRAWEQRQRDKRGFVSYRGVPRELQKQLKALAADLGVPVGDVARRFLEYGLQAYEQGDLKLDPVMRRHRFALYPDENCSRGE